MPALEIRSVTDRLLRIQAEIDEADAVFAVRLGVPSSTWKAIRRGTRVLSGPALIGALNAFPRLFRGGDGPNGGEQEGGLDNASEQENNTAKRRPAGAGRAGRRRAAAAKRAAHA